MFPASREVVVSLLIVVILLLLGMAALLLVSFHRHQRLEDATIDFERSLRQQQGQIDVLRKRLAECDTLQGRPGRAIDTVWQTVPVSNSGIIPRFAGNAK